MGLFGKSTRTEYEEEIPEQETYAAEQPKGTLIAAGTVLKGALEGTGVAQVEGTIEGEIDLKGAVIVSSSGLVKGPVTADVIRIEGRVEGAVTAREQLRLEKTGSLEGDMSTPSLIVVDGGRFNGRSTMPSKADSE